MNAVLLKELRQGIRNRYVLAAYLIFIAVLLIVVGVEMAGFMKVSADHPQMLFAAGKALFLAVHKIFAWVAMVFIPGYTAARLVHERWRADIDLMHATPMPPSALLIGKFRSAVALAGLFLGAALPFFGLSYFIGNIDVPNIVMSVALTLGAVAILTLCAILAAIAPMHKIIRGLALLGLAVFLYVAAEGWVGATEGLCSAGYMNILGNVNSCIGFAVGVALGVSVAVLLYTAALAGFRPVGSDRMRPFRISATALLAGWGAVTALLSRREDSEGALEAWVVVLAFFAIGAMIFGMSERTEPGLYLRKRMPRSRVWRILGYPFRTGQLNAVCWSLLLFAIALGINCIAFPTWEVTEYCFVCRTPHVFPCSMTDREHALVLLLNASAYVLTVFAVWHHLLRRKVPASALWWVTLLVIVLTQIALSAICGSGVEFIKGWVGYLFANKRDVLPWLYIWNYIALVSLIPICLRAARGEAGAGI